MVGSIVARQTAELIFQAWLREMDERRLESEALTWIWLCETHNGSPGTKKYGGGNASEMSANGDRSRKSSCVPRTTSWLRSEGLLNRIRKAAHRQLLASNRKPRPFGSGG